MVVLGLVEARARGASAILMSSYKRQLAPKLQTLMRKQAFESVLQATGVELTWRFALF